MWRKVSGRRTAPNKAALVAKLKASRERKKRGTGKCGGRKSYAETRPEVEALAKALARKRPKGGARSLRAISAPLAAQRYLNERGRPFNPKSIGTSWAARRVL